MFDWMSSSEGWIALATLSLLEIVLGIDNIIMISISVAKLPPEQQKSARNWGLGLAMFIRLILLASLSWIMTLSEPLLTILSFDLSGRDLIMLVGGLFLIGKATFELHEKTEGAHGPQTVIGTSQLRQGFSAILVQILLMDIIFSLDSVITAVGMAKDISIMVIAVILSITVMIALAGSISDFVNRHPTVKILALSFLLLIGTTLVAEGLHFHFPKGYVYFAMFFSFSVEMINLRMRSKSKSTHETLLPS
jgi:predicted tellurium resistance membrane protein TerC